MKLSQIKTILATAKAVNFQLPDGSLVPEHFHVTEIGMSTKKFIDCGGTVRTEKVVNFQLWNANDTDHRLKPEKLQKIIFLSENVLGIEDHEIEIEYQNSTIGKYALDHDGINFLLINKKTDCLAKENCGQPPGKTKLELSSVGAEKQSSCCAPGEKCC
jgi:hypothetical protein